MSTTKINVLIGAIDGVNDSFSTPTPYIAGSLRRIVNGVIYESDDDYFGWAEIDSTHITVTTPPVTGTDNRVIYEEAEAEGSPFGPTE